MTLKHILKQSNYQSFDFLGDSIKDSNSSKKYQQAQLDSYPVKGKYCLDIGCNAGYFLFRLLDKNPALLVGIDLSPYYIQIAQDLNTHYFKSPLLLFYQQDIFDWKPLISFDLVLCFSTFHYFLDKQSDFFNICHQIINPKGHLFLEIEEYPINSIALVDTSPRVADNKSYHYPNQLMIEKWIENKFCINSKVPSVRQGGSRYDRVIYRLERI